MGKTKTAFVAGLEEEDKSSFDRLREKREKQKKEAEKIHISGLKGGQRIKIVEAAPTEEAALEEAPHSAGPTSPKATRAPRLHGKKYREIKTTIDQAKNYPLKEAIELVKKSSYSKFDGTMEVHFVLRKAGLNTQVTLPHSSGKTKRIEVAGEETLTKLAGGKIDFDVLVATPDMMPKLVPFARLLGPKGLMPNPKNGTLVSDIKKANSFSANSTTLKTEKEYPLIHTIIGKVSQNDKELTENFQAIIKAIGDKQIVRAYLKATMSPSVKVVI